MPELLKDLAPTVVALFALWIARRQSRFDARRAFVEFTLRQRTETAVELLAALTSQVQLVHQACYWNNEVAAGRNVKEAMFQRHRTVDEQIPPNTKRMNDALSAAGVGFSDAVLDPANETVLMLNQYMRTPVAVFDEARAIALLSRVAAALREEMLFPEVLKYQRRLFEPSWWGRRIGRAGKNRGGSKVPPKPSS